MKSSPPSGLQAEIRQSRPFRSRAQEAVLSLFRTTDLIKRRHAALTDPHGVSGEQYNVLRILRGAGPAGLPTLDVAERMVVHNPAITRLVDKLEAKRLIVRQRCTEDRRRVYCRITPAGLDLLQKLDEPVDNQSEALLSALPQGDVDELIRILQKIRTTAVPERKTT